MLYRSNKLFTFALQTMTDTPLLVNIKGCGYPPEISCPSFANYYEEIFKYAQNITFNGPTVLCMFIEGPIERFRATTVKRIPGLCYKLMTIMRHWAPYLRPF